MHKRNFKGRCFKKKVSKCKDVARTYSELAFRYLDVLENNDDIISFLCNVQITDEYVTDFVITKKDGTIIVRECIERDKISKPMTIRLLDLSYNHWKNCGIDDWGLVTNGLE